MRVCEGVLLGIVGCVCARRWKDKKREVGGRLKYEWLLSDS